MRIMSQGMVLQEHGDRGKVPQQNVKTLLSLRSSHLKIHRIAKGVVVTVIVVFRICVNARINFLSQP